MDKKNNVRALTECSIMIALATVLSIVKLLEMPYGGSITLASMLPVAIVAYRHGLKHGFATALSVSLIQMLLGMKNFSYFTTWQSLVVLAIFDYVVAFGVFGIAGIFKRKIKKQSTALTVGVLLASVLRYACHVLSGATVWAGLSIPTEVALVYSISYNATYMIPETIILVAVTAYLSSMLDLSAQVPVRIPAQRLDRRGMCLKILAGCVAVGALIFDTATVFASLQNADSGEFDVTLISSVNWRSVLLVTAVCAAISTVLFLASKRNAK